MNKLRKLSVIAVVTFALAACSQQDMIKVRNAVVCARAGMTNCVVHTDKQGESSISGQVCEEDMDCWNCRFMGNGVCGPIIIDSKNRVVIAKNGTFPYIKGYKEGPVVCVDGPNPNHPDEITTLACGKVK